MEIRNFTIRNLLQSSDTFSEKEEKTKAAAQEVLKSIPTIGLEPISMALGAALTAVGGLITYGVAKLSTKVVDAAADDIAKKIYPPGEADPFKMTSCKEAFSASHWFGPDHRKKKLPNPIFDDKTSKLIETLRNAPENVLKDDKGLLPFAWISGPLGTGKTTACEGIARGGNWNYFLLTGQQFIELLQSEETANRFFNDIRNEKLPTVFVVDEADDLLSSGGDDLQKIFEKFRAITGNKDNKLMFLFVTDLLSNKTTDKAFLSRINYQVSVNLPGPKELQGIILQQANRLFRGSLVESFTPEVCEYLAKTVFKGKNGRDVESALLSFDLSPCKLSKQQIHDYCKGYFDEYRS